MSETARMRIDWGSAPIVEVTRPGCKKCGAEQYEPNRGWEDADRVRTSRRVCDACGAPYVVISSPPRLSPESGDFVGADTYYTNTETTGVGLRSIGNIATQLRQSTEAIEEAIQVLGLQPALRLNTIGYFDAHAVKLIATFLDK